MTDQQNIAITNPCEFGEQCAHPRYPSVVSRHAGHLAMSRVTVNVGEEFQGRALWMVSVSLWDAQREEKIPRELWTKRERKLARGVAVGALSGVGIDATDAWEDYGTIITLRRQCRDDERRRVLEYLKVG